MVTIGSVVSYICPRCKFRTRIVSSTGGDEVPDACGSCGFEYMFRLADDYFPARSTGFVLCDAEGRVLGTGKEVLALTGYKEDDFVGRDVFDVLVFSDSDPIRDVLEDGGKTFDQRLTVDTESGEARDVLVDVFAAEAGGLLIAVTPA